MLYNRFCHVLRIVVKLQCFLHAAWNGGKRLADQQRPMVHNLKINFSLWCRKKLDISFETIKDQCKSELPYVEEQVNSKWIYRVFNLKVDRILIWVIYLLRFTTSYITQLTCSYSKCWKWCPFISMHLSTRFTMFLATFLSVFSFFNHFCNSTFYWRLPSKFFKETLSTVGVRHRF